MNEVIYLEPDEEITSVIDKLKTIEGAHSVYLVIPKGAGLLQSVVNLKILKREAESLKLEIGLVTLDIIGRNLASQVGLTVYDSIDSSKPIIEPPKEKPNLNDVIEIDLSEKKPINPPPGVRVNYYQQEDRNQPDNNKNNSEMFSREAIDIGPKTHIAASPISVSNYQPPQTIKPRPPKKWIAKLFFCLAIMVIGLVLIFIYYPKATIDLTIQAEPISEQIEIIVNSNDFNNSAGNTSISGKVIASENELEKEFRTTGKKNVGEKAKGEVTISNEGGTQQILVAQTQLESKLGLLFITTSEVTIPAATASVDPQGNVVKKSGTVKVLVEAKEPGEDYNIDTSDFTIANKPTLQASNSSSFSGGITRQITIVSQDDLDLAKTDLENQLKDTNKTSLIEQSNKDGLSIIESSIANEDKDFIVDKKSGEETEKFIAKLTLRSKSMAFSEDDYRKAVVAVLGDKIPQDKELVLSTDDAIEQGAFTNDFSNGTMKIEGKVQTKLAPKIDYDQIKRSIAGKSILSAENLLRNNGAFSDSKITIHPSWWLKKIPGRIQSIQINKKYSY